MRAGGAGIALVAWALMSINVAIATETAQSATEVSVTVSTPEAQATSAATMPALFLQPVMFAGVLGNHQVQMTLRPKPNEEGIEGSYVVRGARQTILLAGEAEDDTVLMEESVNGTDVSGHWTGTLKNNTLVGQWESVGGTHSKTFSLRLIPTQLQGKQSAEKKSIEDARALPR